MNYFLALITIFLFSCNSQKEEVPQTPYVMVLGVAQDAGYPQMNCKKECCKQAWKNPDLQRTTFLPSNS